MKTKTHIFNGKLYLEGLKRLRIIGLAFAILCLAVCIIIPVATWADEARYDFYDTVTVDPITGEIVEGDRAEHPVEYVEDGMLAIPALIASYLTPLFVFFMFAYLNKRHESDFYHAIPYTRTCVYVSFSAAILTWVFGILIASSLSAGLIWAICPYTTFSFVGLLRQMLYMCLNAGMLMGITAVAVSLMGTFGTAAVAALVLLASWRVVMALAGLYLSDANYMLRFEDILGGYLHPSMLLPVTLFMNEAVVGRVGVLIYAALIMLVTFGLGGFVYTCRRSETAGRAVPAKWLQIAIRCLLALPFGLLITYLFMTGNADGSTLIVLLAVMLLAFYLYELLTSKSVRSMMRATPWLFAVLGVCVVFGCVLGIANHTVNHERIDEDRIVAVGVDSSSAPAGYGLSRYEMLQIQNYMSKNDEAAAIVARALATTQEAILSNNYYFQNIPGGYVDYDTDYAYTRIKLKSGMTITRRIRYRTEDYRQLLEILRVEKNTDPIPDAKEIDYMNLMVMDGYFSISVDTTHYDHILRSMRSEWQTLSEKHKAKFLSGDTSGGGFAVTMRVEFSGRARYLEYAVLPDAMPLTYAMLDTELGDSLDGRDAVETLLGDIEASEDCMMEIVADAPTYEKVKTCGYYTSKDFAEVIAFLREHMDRFPTRNESTNATYIMIRADNMKYIRTEDMEMTSSYSPIVEDKVIEYYYGEDVTCRLALNTEEQKELMRLLERVPKINAGEIVLDEK